MHEVCTSHPPLSLAHSLMSGRKKRNSVQPLLSRGCWWVTMCDCVCVCMFLSWGSIKHNYTLAGSSLYDAVAYFACTLVRARMIGAEAMLRTITIVFSTFVDVWKINNYVKSLHRRKADSTNKSFNIYFFPMPFLFCFQSPFSFPYGLPLYYIPYSLFFLFTC